MSDQAKGWLDMIGHDKVFINTQYSALQVIYYMYMMCTYHLCQLCGSVFPVE
jgi:hypothetical protein